MKITIFHEALKLGHQLKEIFDADITFNGDGSVTLSHTSYEPYSSRHTLDFAWLVENNLKLYILDPEDYDEDWYLSPDETETTDGGNKVSITFFVGRYAQHFYWKAA